MPRKTMSYQGRFKVLREQANRGDMKAMEELHKRYHINQIMIKDELVNLKERLERSLKTY
jgi:hypothetical protein